jgi:hypothetical protein
MVDLSDTEAKPAMTWLRVIRAGGHEPPKDPICQLAYDIARRAGRDHADAEDTASEVRPIVRRHARAHPGFPATPEDLRKFVLKVVVNLITSGRYAGQMDAVHIGLVLRVEPVLLSIEGNTVLGPFDRNGFVQALKEVDLKRILTYIGPGI